MLRCQWHAVNAVIAASFPSGSTLTSARYVYSHSAGLSLGSAHPVGLGSARSAALSLGSARSAAPSLLLRFLYTSLSSHCLRCLSLSLSQLSSASLSVSVSVSLSLSLSLSVSVP